MEYVVTSERLRNFLYSLGFNYRKVPDKTNRQEYVWLFENDDMLKEAITFFSNYKKRKIVLENKNIKK